MRRFVLVIALSLVVAACAVLQGYTAATPSREIHVVFAHCTTQPLRCHPF